MPSMYDLLVTMGADISGLTASMTAAERQISRTTSHIEGSMRTAQRAMAALGVGVSVAGLVAFVKNAYDTADALGKMSQKVGISVEDLSQLKYAAELSDVSVESLQNGIKKLAQTLVESHDHTTKSGMLMRTLGIDISKGVTPVLAQLADRFQTLPDGATKSALAVQLFGRAGLDLIPLLNAGSAGINELKAEAARLGLTLDTGTAKAAEKVNDQMRAAKASIEALGRSVVETTIPSMTRITSAMKTAAEQSGILAAAWVGLGGIASELLGLNDSEEEKIKKRLRDITEEISKFKDKITPDRRADLLSGAVEPANMIEGAYKRAAVEMRALESLQKAISGGYDDQATRAARQGQALAKGAGSAKDLENNLKGVLSGLTQVNTKASELETLLNKLTAKSAGLESSFGKDSATLFMGYASGAINIETFTAAQAKLIAQQPVVVDWSKRVQDNIEAENKRREDNAAAIVEQGEALADLVNHLEEEAESMEFEVSMLGRSRIEREKALMSLRMQRDLLAAAGNPSAVRDIEENYRRMFAAIDASEHITKQIDLWSDLGSFISDVAMLALDDWENFGDSLIRMMSNVFRQIMAIMAQKMVMNIAANVMGGGTGSALSSAASAVGQGSAAWNMASAAGSYVSGMSVMGTTVGTFADAYAGWQAASMGVQVAAMEGATWMTTLGAALQNIPLWGWIAAAILAVGVWLSGRGGGDKLGGSFLGAMGAAGEVESMLFAGANAGDNGRLLSPQNDEADSAMRDLITRQHQSYRRLLAQFGASGAIENLSFGMAFTHDPRGDAQSQLRSTVVDAMGNTLYDAIAEMDDKEIGPAMALELKRQIVAALQATDLGSDFVNAYLDSIENVGDLTSEAIDEIIQTALEFYTIVTNLSRLELGATWDIEALKNFQREGETLFQTFQRVGGQWAQLRDNFLPEGTKLRNAQTQLTGLYTSLAEFGYQVPTTREGWLDVMQSIDVTDEAGADLWERMMALAGSFDAVTAATERQLNSFDDFMRRTREGYGADLDKLNLSNSVANFMGAAGWTAGMTPQQVIEALRTITREDFLNYSQSNRELILSILTLDNSITGAADKISAAAGTSMSVLLATGGRPGGLDSGSSATALGQAMFDGFEGKYGGLIGTGSSLMDRLIMRRDFSQDEIRANARRMGAIAKMYGGVASQYEVDAEFMALAKANSLLQAQFNMTGKDITHLIGLTNQYGTSVAEAIFDLDKWYKEQQVLLADNGEAMLALTEYYGKRRNEIIEEEEAKRLERLEKAQSDLRDWLDGLLTNKALSPLTPEEQFGAARARYETLLSLAQDGDIDAMMGLRGAAEEYLSLARMLFASGSDYTAIFREVFGQVGEIADYDVDARLYSALPESGKLASSNDIAELKQTVNELITVIASGVSTSDADTAAALAALADAIRQSGYAGAQV